MNTHLWICDWCQLLLLQLVNGVLVLPEIELGADQDDGHVGAVMPDFGVPFGTNVFERGGVHQ